MISLKLKVKRSVGRPHQETLILYCTSGIEKHSYSTQINLSFLLQVNGEKLLGMNHHGVVATLKELPMHVRMVCARRLSPTERETHPSLSQANYSHPYHMEYDLSTVPDFMGRGLMSGPFGGSLTSLTPTSERLVKAKSDGSLAIGTSAASSPPMEAALSKLKSRSLEPLTGLAMWSSEPQIIELMKGDRGLGFSILDYQVSVIR